MNLAKDDCLFERAWVFQVGCDCDARLILHGHSFLAWSKRSEVGVEKRADDLTSVNWRLARRDASGWKQAGAGYECLPLKKIFLGADTTQLGVRPRSLGSGVNGRVINRGSRLPT